MMLRVAGETVRTMALCPNPSVPPVTNCNTHTHTHTHTHTPPCGLVDHTLQINFSGPGFDPRQGDLLASGQAGRHWEYFGRYFASGSLKYPTMITLVSC